MVFTVSQRKYIGNHATIVAVVKGEEKPVLHLIASETDFPGDVGKLTANIAQILNGKKPEHNLALPGVHVNWRAHANGIELRLRKPAGKDGYLSVSKGSLLVAVDGTAQDYYALVQKRLCSAAGAKALCDTLQASVPGKTPEQRPQNTPA